MIDSDDLTPDYQLEVEEVETQGPPPEGEQTIAVAEVKKERKLIKEPSKDNAKVS